MAASKNDERAVSLVPQGLKLGREVLPLLSGAVHYFRLEPETWRSALDGVKRLGLGIVETYVPWGVHELATGEFDFGRIQPRLDVARFVRLAGELGLKVFARPGPHINAELTYFGIPERVIWTKECQALSAGGKPVVLPMPPQSFPVPSFASEAFHAETELWFHAVGRELAPLMHPNGPIVFMQVDNEGAMYFRDGVYDQDYHPDAIGLYREFLQNKYGSVQALRDVLGDPEATFFNVEPPRRFSATTALELARHLDWAEFQEVLIARAFARYSRGLERAGLGGVPTCHNFPISESATPLDPGLVGESVDLLGLDYYHGASPPQRAEIARRTSELAVRCAAREQPAFACELGAGFPPFFPPLSPDDNLFTALTALAYGLRGFNLYMAVERDRWIGAPIDRRGRMRPFAAVFQKLTAALERVKFWELERHVPVHIVIPRSLRRLSRVMHAFGPLSAAAFQVIGGGAEEACFEDDLGLDGPLAIQTARYVRELERVLDAAHVPYAFSGGDVARYSLKNAAWTIVVSCGALEPSLVRRVARSLDKGRAVTLGPYAPVRDASFRPLAEPLSLSNTPDAPVPALLPFDLAAMASAVERARERLALETLPVEPADVRVTLHHDRKGVPRVLFVINASHEPRHARVAVSGATTATDLFDGRSFRASFGAFELPVPSHGVCLLELDG
jgi:beta-galactosidase